jgi:hypothetical protein
MNSMETRERLLAAAHRVIAGRIDDSLPGPHDDAEAEYADEGLADAAAAHARARLRRRLEKGVPTSALEARIRKQTEQLFDDATSAVAPGWVRQSAAEVAVMELCLIEIVGDGDLSLDEVREMAADALPEGAARRSTLE